MVERHRTLGPPFMAQALVETATGEVVGTTLLQPVGSRKNARQRVTPTTWPGRPMRGAMAGVDAGLPPRSCPEVLDPSWHPDLDGLPRRFRSDGHRVVSRAAAGARSTPAVDRGLGVHVEPAVLGDALTCTDALP